MDRDVLGLAERLAGGVEQRRRAVAPLLDVSGMRGADQRLASFIDDRGQGCADHFDGDGVEGVHEVPPHAKRGEVSAKRTEGPCVSSTSWPMTPPSPHDGDTSPSRTPRRGGRMSVLTTLPPE